MSALLFPLLPAVEVVVHLLLPLLPAVEVVVHLLLPAVVHPLRPAIEVVVPAAAVAASLLGLTMQLHGLP
jgi:hypothetical protein